MCSSRLHQSDQNQIFKTAQRAAFAHAIVNFGARLTFEKDELTVVDAHVIVGGATKHLLEALETASVLKGKKLNLPHR